MSEPALCQCTKCHRYLARDREPGGPQLCVDCDATHDGTSGGLPLALLRQALADPLSIELLGIMTEECGEVSQRIGKIMRWGWEADFGGTTQKHKLETELGDILAAITLCIHNGIISREELHAAFVNKLRKFWEDVNGPRQRLQVASVPTVGFVHFGISEPGEDVDQVQMDHVFDLLAKLWTPSEGN